MRREALLSLAPRNNHNKDVLELGESGSFAEAVRSFCRNARSSRRPNWKISYRGRLRKARGRARTGDGGSGCLGPRVLGREIAGSSRVRQRYTSRERQRYASFFHLPSPFNHALSLSSRLSGSSLGNTRHNNYEENELLTCKMLSCQNFIGKLGPLTTCHKHH